MNNNFDIYISSLAFESFQNAVDYCVKNNLNLEITNFYDPEEFKNFKQEKLTEIENLLKNNKQIKTVLHGFFSDLDPSSNNIGVLNKTKQWIINSIDLAKRFESQKIVYHSGYKVNKEISYEKEQFIKNSITFWKEVLLQLKANDIELNIENAFEKTPDYISEIIDQVNHPCLKMCIDTGHVNCYSEYFLEEYYLLTQKHVSHFHFHNNYGERDEHNSLEDGTMDFPSFINVLKRSNKKPSITLEVFSIESLEKSLALINDCF